jgi:hypothetical protein
VADRVEVQPAHPFGGVVPEGEGNHPVGDLMENDRRDQYQEVDDLEPGEAVGSQQDGDNGYRHHHDDGGALVAGKPTGRATVAPYRARPSPVAPAEPHA